jgi:uncharacterized protein
MVDRLDEPVLLVEGIPYLMGFHVRAPDYSYDGDRLVLSAGAESDCFFDPAGERDRFDAPLLLCRVPGDFVLTANVDVEFSSVFDAGTLVVFADDANWAKLCLEYSTEQEPRVVSVVTHGRSDDANGHRVADEPVLARISRRGPALAFHVAGADGRFELVRHFSLAAAGTPLRVGFGVQSPNGDGCRATFDSIELIERTVADIRSGE